MAGAHQTQRRYIDCRGVELEWGDDVRALVMGVLNVTPDSFSDGGLYIELEAAVDRVGQMLDEGADLIDIGGESSRPAGATYGAGASKLPAAEEVDRVVPVIEAVLRSFPDCVISIDTYKAEVARATLRAGAHIINDITALRADPEMGAVAAQANAPIVLMHSVGLPGEMPHVLDHDDVVSEVEQALVQAASEAERCGVSDVILDPGFGFGKSVSDNLRLMARLDKLTKHGKPVLIGVSRKSSIGSVLRREGTPRAVGDRLAGSLAVTAIAVANGASIVRTHDVLATRDVVEAVHALKRANAESPQAVS